MHGCRAVPDHDPAAVPVSDGPTVLDRLVGVNAIGSKTVVLLLLIGYLYERVDMFVDIALAYAFLNFVAVLAASRYFHKRKGLYEESFME